jgi:hypothetical protein
VGVLSIKEEMLNNQRRSFARRGMIRSKRAEVRIRTENATAKENSMHPKDPYTSPGKSIRKTIMNIRGWIPRVGSRRSVCKTANEDSGAKIHTPCLDQSDAIDNTDDHNINSGGDCTNDLSPCVSPKIIGKEEHDIFLDGPSPKSDFVPPEFIFIDTSDTWISELNRLDIFPGNIVI